MRDRTMGVSGAMFVVAALLANPIAIRAQDPKSVPGTLDTAALKIKQDLDSSLAELATLRDQLAGEKTELARQLSELEGELHQLKQTLSAKSKQVESSANTLSRLIAENKQRREDGAYISNLLVEYARNFESRLHVAELQRYRRECDAARLAVENQGLHPAELYRAQVGLLGTALDRLHDALGGTRFDGQAVLADGVVKAGTFTLLGPTALFRTADGTVAGTVEQRIGSLEPNVVGLLEPEATASANQVIATASGSFPLDPTLGNARKAESVKETLWQHIVRGGTVMAPILALAGAALLVALYKWLSLSLVRRASRRQITALLEAVANEDQATALQQADAIGGPTGKMLAAGVEHWNEPRELIEEIMYEAVLKTRLKLQSFLPFIAITASSAPLLGLLGTVTGIMNTFTQMTVHNTGDIKSLSGGISEALITTEYGLYVAIPALLLHALLSRKARSLVDSMEEGAVALLNQIGKTRKPFVVNGSDPHSFSLDPATETTGHATTDQVREILIELLTPLASKPRQA